MRSSDVPQMGHACARVIAGQASDYGRLVRFEGDATIGRVIIVIIPRGMRLSAVRELRAVFAAQTILMLL
jgi:hypothetical protein